jgi:2'-5' RNA ligase
MQHLFNIEPFTKINKRDYLIVIPPVDDISMKIMYYKLKAWELIGDYPSLHSKAHITVNHDPNIQSLVFEEKLTYYRRKLPNINSFEMKVCGFDKFRHNANSYTIYAKIEISKIVEEALSALNRTFSKGVVKTPHITIARTVSKKKADILWRYFAELKFERSFYADKINVLETPTRKHYNLPMRLKTQIKLAAAS